MGQYQRRVNGERTWKGCRDEIEERTNENRGINENESARFETATIVGDRVSSVVQENGIGRERRNEENAESTRECGSH